MDTWKQEKTGRHILRHFNYGLVALGDDKEIWAVIGSGFSSFPDLQVIIPRDKTLQDINSAMLYSITKDILYDPFIITILVWLEWKWEIDQYGLWDILSLLLFFFIFFAP